MNKKELMGKLLKSKFVGNTGWLLFQYIYSMLLSLVIGSLSARYLGPSNYGLIGYSASLVTLCSSLSQLGLNNILLNELITKPEEQGKTLGTALFIRLAASVVSFLGVLLFVNIMEPGNKILLVITVLQAFAIIFNAYELLNQWFLAEFQSKVYVIAAVVGSTVVGIWRIALLVKGATVQWFAASAAIQALVCGGIVFFVFMRRKTFHFQVSFPRAKELFAKSNPYIIAGLAIEVYTQIDKVMLGKMAGERVVGLYTSAMTIAMLWEFIPQSIINSASAVILKKKKNSYEEYVRFLQFLFLGISVMGLGVGIAIQLLGKYAILILYGKQYMEAIPILKVLIWSTSFAMIGTARGIWSVAEDKNRFAKYYTTIGCVFNVIFNYFAIQIWGMMGAAVVTLLSQIIVSLGTPLLWKETRPFVKLYFTSWLRIKDVIQLIRGYRK